MPFNVVKTIRKDGLNVWTILNKQLYDYLKILGKSHQKYIPRQFLDLKKEYLQILFKSLMDGDGTWRGSGGRYYTISKQLADDVQEIAFKLGYGASISLRNSGTKYRVNITKELHSKINDHWSVSPQKVNYCGKVYCLEVEQFHKIYVRRNGKVCWSGNSYDPYRQTGFTIANQAPLPIKAIVRQLTAESLIMREVGLIATGAIEIVVEERDVNAFRACEKVQYKEKDYVTYNEALGNRIQITNTIYGFSKIVLFPKGN